MGYVRRTQFDDKDVLAFRMSDRDVIVQLLRNVEWRLRATNLLRDLALALCAALAVLVGFKLLDFVFLFSTTTIRVVLALTVLAFLGYAGMRGSKRRSLMEAAAAADRLGSLSDELKSAYWFIRENKKSDWVDRQVQRAARTARGLNVQRVLPVRLPQTSLVALGLFGLLLGLNFAPLPWSHNWLYSQPAPAFDLSKQEQQLIDKTRELLKMAQQLEKTEVAEQIEQILQNLESGEITPEEALQQLQGVQNELGEGNLDMASIEEGLSDMANDLQESEQMQELAQNMADRDLKEAAEDMRRLAEQMGMSTSPPNLQEQMTRSLDKAAENSRPGLEGLTKDLKEASENMKAGDQQGVQEALQNAANELDKLAEKMESQQLRNEAGKQLQSLEDALRQRQEGEQQQSSQQGNQQQKGQQQQKGAPNAQQQGGQQGQQQAGQAQGGEKGQEAQEPGQPGESEGEGSNEGSGQMPSGSKTGSSQKEGPPTKLEVQLEMEKLAGQFEEGEENPMNSKEIEESSKQERSKLDYRNVRSELSSAQQDLLNQDRIPWDYRPLIKNYFQAIKPRGKNDR